MSGRAGCSLRGGRGVDENDWVRRGEGAQRGAARVARDVPPPCELWRRVCPPANVQRPMDLRPGGRRMEVSDQQPSKAWTPNVARPAGTVTEVSDAQFRKHPSPSEERPAGSTTAAREVQPLKHCSPIDLRLLGHVMETTEVRPKKALSGKTSIPSGRVAWPPAMATVHFLAPL